MPALTDTHCHLNLNLYHDDLPEVLDRAWGAGVERILIPGIDLESSRSAVQMTERDARVFAAVGVHPNDALTWNDQSLAELRQMAQHPRVAAIGEIGLDYYRDHAPHEQQVRILREQLTLAAEVNKPVVLHQRDSQRDLWPIMAGWQQELARNGHALAMRPGVFHSYDGSLAAAQAIVQQGFWVGISGPVTYKNAHERQELARNLPQDKCLLETDAPFLTPHPWRGRRNEPGYVVKIAEKIAELRGMNLEMIALITTQNANQLFAWGNAL